MQFKNLGCLAFHVFVFDPFGFVNELADEEDRDDGTKCVESIGSPESDAGEHDWEGHGDAEVSEPLGEATDREAGSAHLVREHFAEHDPHDRTP